MGLTQRLDALRERGWTVAVHNDYRQQGLNHTFWLFTKGDRCAKGEGRTDEKALAQVEATVASVEAEVSLTVGEAAVRLGDQARVRRALDRVVEVRQAGSDVEEEELRLRLATGDGFIVISRGQTSHHKEVIERCLVSFLEEVLRG